MLIKKETEYATFGLIFLAKHQNEFCFIKDIAKKENVPMVHLAKIFQRLNRAHLIESRSGNGGGFRLAKDSRHIRLLDIMKAVQQKNVMKCYEGNGTYCRRPYCKFKKIASKIEEQLDQFFSKTSLYDIINNY